MWNDSDGCWKFWNPLGAGGLLRLGQDDYRDFKMGKGRGVPWDFELWLGKSTA